MLTEESTDYHQDKTDMFPTNTRLSNSDILDNLDSKLEHLDSEKQSELKKLNLDYKHLFPDVPSRTDKIFHDVDIEMLNPSNSIHIVLIQKSRKFCMMKSNIFWTMT